MGLGTIKYKFSCPNIGTVDDRVLPLLKHKNMGVIYNVACKHIFLVMWPLCLKVVYHNASSVKYIK